jgi:hypothetical protein
LECKTTECSRDGKEDGFPGFACLKQGLGSLEEKDRTNGVNVDVVAYNIAWQFSDAGAGMRNAGIGNNNIERCNSVLRLELLNRATGVGFDRGIKFDNDELGPFGLVDLLKSGSGLRNISD